MFDEGHLVWISKGVSKGVYIKPRKVWVCCIYTKAENKRTVVFKATVIVQMIREG